MRKILLPPVLTLLCLIGIYAVKRYGADMLGGASALHDGSWNMVGYLFIAVGIALPVWGARIFKKHETNIIPYKSPDSMVTEGPFGFTRNPMYLGMLLLITGVAVLGGTLEGFAFPILFFIVANWWYIPFEEMKMAKVFGGAFTEYKSKVRRWL